MKIYRPDKWVVLKMKHEDKTFYKILGGWGGGYLHGQSWRLNSGVIHAEYDEEGFILFNGSSNSVYACHPNSYGLGVASLGAYELMKKTYPDQVELMEPRSVEEWTEMKYE